jgi:2-polyprenyl-3-methyl-5-hydroxy-6-metoxy-1,4-benzoquinol methylase
MLIFIMKHEVQRHNKASEWFDEFYRENRDEYAGIPWARLTVNPLLKRYLQDESGRKGEALIIGCGLGDDAEAVDVAGYDVLAIDVSQSALELAAERFSDGSITFEQQDIFDMPEKYRAYFDFVFEAFTIQSLPVEFRETMIKAVAETVAPNGKLLVVAHKKEHQFDGPPWPLEQHDIDLFKTQGLTEILLEQYDEESKISSTLFNVLYQK